MSEIEHDNGDVTDYDGKLLSPDEVTRRVYSLREMVLGEPQLKDIRTDDEFMLRYLYSTLFNVNLAFKRMQNYFETLDKYPNVFASCGPLEKRELIETNAKVILTDRDKLGRPIYIFKVGRIDADKSTAPDEMQIDEIWLESVMEDNQTHRQGMCVILDLKDYSWRLFKWLTPYNVRGYTKKLDAFPIRDAMVHVVNTSALVNASIKLVWPFLSERIKKMVKFHFSDLSALQEYIDVDVLPPEYGGNGPEVNHENLNRLLFDQDREIERRLRHQHMLKSKIEI